MTPHTSSMDKTEVIITGPEAFCPWIWANTVKTWVSLFNNHLCLNKLVSSAVLWCFV